MSNLITRCIFGGVYNNYLSLEALFEKATKEGATSFYCLGDIGGFGPYPDRVFPFIKDKENVFVMQGNYDHSIGNRLDDCACGYVDPEDQANAQISYDYTLKNTSDINKDWLRDLPSEFRFEWANTRILMSHGSPRRTNEFLWESTCSDVFLLHLLNEYKCDILFITHTGIPWIRDLGDGRKVVNVGVIGRPPNDGTEDVDYVLLHEDENGIRVEPKRLSYDNEQLACDMEDELLPSYFVETIRTGWWTTCLDVLPAKERAIGPF